ncbi:MAG: hypothetical protein ABFS43_15480 [Thermodesulfobacteriota bacterium]
MDGELPGLVTVRKSYKCPGSLGAHLLPGTKSGQDPSSSGDCILLDFENRFFGLSDSSDRDPGASRRFLLQFDCLLSSIAPDPTTTQTFATKDLEQWVIDLTANTKRLLLNLKGKGSCTFTGLHMLSTANGLASVLMHTGDSALYEFVPSTQKLFLRTENNFWMVGRTDNLYQIAVLEPVPESIFILTTDGLSGLHDASTSAPKMRISHMLRQTAVEDIPEKLIVRQIQNSGLHDDAAAITIDPRRLKSSKRKILVK